MAALHKSPYYSKGNVINCETVFFDDLKIPVPVWGIGCALTEYLGDAVLQ